MSQRDSESRRGGMRLVFLKVCRMEEENKCEWETPVSPVQTRTDGNRRADEQLRECINDFVSPR